MARRPAGMGMTEDFQRESAYQDYHGRVHRLCRHKYAGTLHVTNLWWSDSDDQVLGTAALGEHLWLDHLGRARLQVDLGSHPLRLQALSADARECLVPITTYVLTDTVGHTLFVRQIAEEIARENEALVAAARGIVIAEAWLRVLESLDLHGAWQDEMASRGYAGDSVLESPYHSAMPAKLVQQALRTWSAAYDGAKARHESLLVEWAALKGEDAQ